MTRKYTTYRILSLALVFSLTMLWTACTRDADADTRAGGQTGTELHLVPCAQTYSDVTATVTRSLPAGYVVYDALSPRMPLDRTSIRGYVTYANRVDFMGDFVYRVSGEGSEWTAKIPLDEQLYNIYGFMPADEYRKVRLSVPDGKSYAEGAVMTISGLPAVTTDDPCVIVGVKGWNDNKTIIQNIPLTPGKFQYKADEGQYVYLLIDHLYSGLRMRFSVDAGYHALRHIQLTRLTIRAEAADAAQTVGSVEMTATLTAGNEAQPLAVGVSPNTGDAATVPVYDGEELVLNDTDPQEFMVCVAPFSINRRFRIETCYNVYDRKGNLIRENQKASNVLTIPSSKDLQPGQLYTFNLTVKPTYLYQLSDPDLDSPTLNVN